MKTIGIYGGTFNPVHNGHLVTALHVFEKRNLDKIIFIPCFISPLKQDQNHSSGEDRLNMLKLAIEDIPFFEVSEIELKRKEVSYTVDTIRELKKIFDKIELIIGYDNYSVFDQWHKPEDVINLADVIVLKRKTESQNIRHNFGERMIFLDSPMIEISSTVIRKRVQNNLPIDFFVPERVKEYIFEKKIYKN